MDAKTLYQQGVTAVKQGDMVNGRNLLLQSLKLHKDNDTAWLWVARTIAEPDKQLQCVERALAINPNNPTALKLQASLASGGSMSSPATSAPQKRKGGISSSEQVEIKRLMTEAEMLVKQNRKSEAADKWVFVLDIQADHEEALRKASQYYMDIKMIDAVAEMLFNAVEQGTENPSILLSARDIAIQNQDNARLDMLNEQIALSPQIPVRRVLKIAEEYTKSEIYDRVLKILTNGLSAHPEDPEIMHRLAEVNEQIGREHIAMQYYERVANQSGRSKLGKAADKRLAQSVPVITDIERGSMRLAWREVLGIFMLFFFLAWQDAGANTALMGSRRWMGVILSLVGGYLLVTATSSPQQQPLAGLLGGHVPDFGKTPQRRMNWMGTLLRDAGMDIKEENFYSGPIDEPTDLPIIPIWLRLIMGTAGLAMLILAFALVFTRALGLVSGAELNLDPEFYELFF